MSIGDKLIIAGVVTVPAVLAVALGIETFTSGDPREWGLVFLSASVAVAAGLITTGVLMRKNRG